MEIGMDFMREEMEEGGGLHNTDEIEMTFHVENRVDDDMGDEDDDMGDDGEEDEDDDEGRMRILLKMVLGHDDTGSGDDYNDEMIDEEDDDFHENRVIEPFEGVNVDDLFGLCSLWVLTANDRVAVSSFERLVTDLEALSSGSFDVAPFNMFDAPVLPYEHVPSSIFGDRSVPQRLPPLSDYFVGMDSLHTRGRRGLGDGRWIDDGRPQLCAQARYNCTSNRGTSCSSQLRAVYLQPMVPLRGRPRIRECRRINHPMILYPMMVK
ncbi:unnamed protein product [Dovyalis caffra]|uniref:Uncharacterized protein n=1 Tax=Dovyalis caffra TaxID=77055 RepID=A0AAV1QSH7_9ROSI|nr:unnamed protein product [Dovyalis caffra]